MNDSMQAKSDCCDRNRARLVETSSYLIDGRGNFPLRRANENLSLHREKTQREKGNL